MNMNRSLKEYVQASPRPALALAPTLTPALPTALPTALAPALPTALPKATALGLTHTHTTNRECTSPKFTPVPTGCHAAPSHRATPRAATVPLLTNVKRPPTASLPL